MNKSPTQRVEALTDGVFAIVMTLLVLELSIPVISGTSSGTLLTHRLIEMWPKYLSYVVSFLVLGLWWLYHHGVFENIKRVDGRLLYYNLFFLMFVSLVPFSASLVAEYWREGTSALIYGINMLLCFLQLNAISLYAAKKRLIAVEPDAAYVKSERRAQIRILLLIVFAILISFINSVISLLLWGLMSGFYILAILVNREGLQARKSKS
ncbi:MAG: DUF1211 domain-containing protein [candidate division WOR-3 bacterium]|nr:MAG: DUF1211 domain-containing protein [candidate division WOR-3 bacterium]